ncbi:MAG: hypothetical protein FWF57_08005 [Defluviitaleaceae bacterium]|nr:hypothetical protein [Defluviitaleaceae bacterium]
MNIIKNKKNIITLVVAILAVISVVAIFATNRNSTNKSYEELEREFFSSFLNLTNIENNSVDFSFSYIPPESLGALAMLGINNIPTIGFNMEATSLDDNFFANLNLIIDDFDVDVQALLQDNRFKVLFPAISNYFFNLDVNVNSDLPNTDIYKINNIIEAFLDAYFEILPSTIQYENSTLNYHNFANMQDISVNARVYRINFTNDFIYQVANNFFDRVNDDTIRDNFYSNFWNNIDDFDFVMYVYTDGSRIIGRRLESQTGTVLNYINVLDRNNLYFEISLYPYGNIYNNDVFRTFADLSRQNATFSGPLTIRLQDNNSFSGELTLNLDGFSRVGNLFSGGINLNHDIQGINLNLDIDLNTNGNTQMIDISGRAGILGMSIDIGNLNISYATSNITNITLPNLDTNFEITSEELEQDFNSISGFSEDFHNFIQNIENEAIRNNLLDFYFTIFMVLTGL